MCYAHGSIDQAVNWARSNPPTKQAGSANPGWPGCCRAPTLAEHKMIQPADWKSVSVVHQIPIPPEIKAALESLGTRASPVPGGIGRATTIKSNNATTDRKSNGSPSRSTSLSRSSVTIKQRTSSPKQAHSSIASNLPRSGSSVAVSSSVPTASTMEQMQAQRRQSTERRIEGTHSSNSSPRLKNVDLEASFTPRRNSSTTKTISITPSPSSVSLSKGSIGGGRSPPTQTSTRRRASISSPKETPSTKGSSIALRAEERSTPFVISRDAKKDDLSSASSSSGSDGTGSMTDSTVTSDGGFTDYLSDESEAELQRQAEARAALLAQSQAEELEFKAARLQLAHIDLRPPKSWNPTNITNNTATPRRVT
ncbi:hypothetical protein H0H92_000818 [Tricholoma furcatifolium]|nr:hypothetical protein H0H92_000818 [Tricholoma furcatifolium]